MSGAETLPCRVLVIEDEPMIAMVIEDVIESMGWEIIGPVAHLEEALTLARSTAIDCAVLDINIRGGLVYPVAELLLDREIPLLIASGYGDWTLPERLLRENKLPKPYTSDQLENELRALQKRARQSQT